MSGKLERRKCACGCGETFETANPKRRYLNNVHVQRGMNQRHQSPEFEKVCACGCGAKFKTRSARKTFLNPEHLRRHHSVSRGGPADLSPQERGVAVDNTRLRATNLRLAKENDELQRLIDKYSTIHSGDTRVPTWIKTVPKGLAPGSKHSAIPVLMLSDLHLDEVVDLGEMDGINEFNREIAVARLQRIVEASLLLLKRYVTGVHYDGLFLAILGDVITGIIHAELERTNEKPVPATIAYWVPIIASAIQYIASELDVPIHVACVDGNHDRTYGKPPAKQRAESSWAWVIYNWLADHLRDDDRITFTLTTSNEQIIPVYDTKFLLSHGDSFRSQGGVGGLYPSMLKWLHRRHELYSSTKQDFDYALIGHWHQTLYGQDFFVNGSLKGYDEYAKSLGFKFERPQQTLFLVTPERGVVQRLTVHAD